MESRAFESVQDLVALLAEGVDRNKYVAPVAGALKVALLAEGVDRNIRKGDKIRAAASRPPRGGRG